MLIQKEFTFDAAHNLINYNGKCANVHGHTYTLHVVVEGKVQKSGMVMDFGEIKDIVTNKVLTILDHHYINDILKQPTAENIVMWIWKVLESDLNLYEIKLWESPTNCVIYHGAKKKKPL